MPDLRHNGSRRLRVGHRIERLLFEVPPNIAALIGGDFDDFLNLASGQRHTQTQNRDDFGQ